MTEVRTRPQLLAELGRYGLGKAVDAGEYVRVFHGGYVPGDTEVTLEVKAEVAAELLPPQTWMADRSLLLLLGIDVMPPGVPVIEAVVPRGAVIPRRSGIRVRETLIPEEDQFRFRAVRCLRPVRAVADLLRRLPLADAVATCDAVLHRGTITQEQIEQELTRHAKLRGIRQAYSVLELSTPLAESPPESKVRLQLVQAGLIPVPQYDVFDGQRWLARVDLAFPDLKIAIEYDGREVHEREDVFTRDRQRQNNLVRAGWIVLRFTAQDLRNGTIVATVVAAIRRAAA